MSAPKEDGGELNIQQRRFVEEYLVDLNATRAAIRAGYSPASAHSQGPRLLAHAGVATAIATEQQRRAKRTGISADRVLREIARIAFSNVADVVDNSSGELTVKPLRELPRSVQHAVEEISERPGKDGTTRKVKLHNKVAALKLLVDHLGLNAPSRTLVALEEEDPEADKLSDAELAARIAEMKARSKPAAGSDE